MNIVANILQQHGELKMSPFEKKLDILMYVTHASQPVSRADIMADATDLSITAVADALGNLMDCGLVACSFIGCKSYYEPTDKAKKMFGIT